MPGDKPLTIATYAAGASLAAITLVYVFGPTFFLDGDANSGLKGNVRRPAVGLTNPANGTLFPCYIHSVPLLI
jgi:ubiquitin carboxyl-terminal hydrolase 16